jgi:hypothetical protein
MTRHQLHHLFHHLWNTLCLLAGLAAWLGADSITEWARGLP